MADFALDGVAAWAVATYLLFLPALAVFSLPLLIWKRNRVSSVGWIALGLNAIAVAIGASHDLALHPALYVLVGLVLVIGGVMLWPSDPPWWRL